MHISEDDLFPLLRQRMLLKTFRSNPWLTIDQIYTVYKGLLLENIYLPCHDDETRFTSNTLVGMVKNA
jgi:hypothetical protein